MRIDISPFGFTPTESRAYSALVEHGPSSGYALARALSVARANAYQALHGLVAKDAAVLTTQEAPQLFRAVAPTTLLALLAQRQASQLDRLEAQVQQQARSGAPGIVEFSSEREFQQLTLRTAARAPGTVTFIGPEFLLSLLIPIWRKRSADSATTLLWAVGEEPADFPLPLAGTVSSDSVREHFGSLATLLVTRDQAIIARLGDDTMAGLWSSKLAVVGVARAAAAAITEL